MLDLNWIFFFTNAFLFVFVKGKKDIFIYFCSNNNVNNHTKRRKEGFSIYKQIIVLMFKELNDNACLEKLRFFI